MEAGRPGEYEDEVDLMKVLVVGYGSIGKRHVRNLLNIASVKDINVYTKIKDGLDDASKQKVTFIDASINDLASVTDQYKFDFAIIANETYKHVDTAIILAKRGIHLFIEKPFTHNYEKLAMLEEIVHKKGIKVFIAYNLRYLPAIVYIKKELLQEVLGDLYFAQIEVGQYLPTWRSTVNYTDCYSSKSESGGGVALDLSHEVDYMRFLFGEPASWKTMKAKASNLDINCEDVFEGIYKYKQGFVCHIHMDYLQLKAKRQIRIVGSQGQIICNLIDKWIDVETTDHKTRLKDDYLFATEDTYKTELKRFIEAVKKDKAVDISIDDGIKALELLEDSYDR